MADMHKFPRNSVELAQHESVVPEEQSKANKSLKKFAVVLAACAILFLGVMAVAAIAQTEHYEYAGEGHVSLVHVDINGNQCSKHTSGTCHISWCYRYRNAECRQQGISSDYHCECGDGMCSYDGEECVATEFQGRECRIDRGGPWGCSRY
jgi:hypothetical protein